MRWNTGLVSSHCRGIGPHLELRGESYGFSWVVVGSLGFLSSFHEDLRESLVLPQGSQASFRVVRATSGFLLSRCRGIGPCLKSQQEIRSSCRVATGITGKLWRYIKGVKPPFKLGERTHDCSWGPSGESSLISHWWGNLVIFLELRWEAWGSSRVATRTSGNVSVASGKILNWYLGMYLGFRSLFKSQNLNCLP